MGCGAGETGVRAGRGCYQDIYIGGLRGVRQFPATTRGEGVRSGRGPLATHVRVAHGLGVSTAFGTAVTLSAAVYLSCKYGILTL